MSNSFNARYEEEIMELEEYSMAQLMARRMQKFIDNPHNTEFAGKGFEVVVASSNGGARLSVISNKDVILTGDVSIFQVLAKTYVAILMPFFPELEEKEKASKVKEHERVMKAARKKARK